MWAWPDETVVKDPPNLKKKNPAETNKIKAGLSTKRVPHLHTCPCVPLILHHINYIFAHSVLLPPINFPIKEELRKIYAKKNKTN